MTGAPPPALKSTSKDLPTESGAAAHGRNYLDRVSWKLEAQRIAELSAQQKASTRELGLTVQNTNMLKLFILLGRQQANYDSLRAQGIQLGGQRPMTPSPAPSFGTSFTAPPSVDDDEGAELNGSEYAVAATVPSSPVRGAKRNGGVTARGSLIRSYGSSIRTTTSEADRHGMSLRP